MGAGSKGTLLIATIKSVNGLIASLDTNASITVSGVDVGYGNIGPIESAGSSIANLSTPGIIFGYNGNNPKDLNSQLSYSLQRSSGSGSYFPYNSANLVLRTAYNDSLAVVQTRMSVDSSVSTVVQGNIITFPTSAGTIVTVITPSAHDGVTGDSLTVYGSLDDGINTKLAQITYINSTSFSYISSSSLLNTGASGTITYRLYKTAKWSNGVLALPSSGLAIQNNSGIWNTILSTSNSNVCLNFAAPDYTNGYLDIIYGTGITTGNAVYFSTSQYHYLIITGNGVIKQKPSATPNTDSSYGEYWTDFNDGFIHCKNINGIDTILTLDKTITASGTDGAQTINKPCGSVNFAAGASSLVVTNSLVTTSSLIYCQIMTNDSTMKSVVTTVVSGSFTIIANAATTSETKVAFRVI